jgi:protein-L-isoaspartate(D-aspartate) O-methyltransferase
MAGHDGNGGTLRFVHRCRKTSPRAKRHGQGISDMVDYERARRSMVDSQVRPHDVTDLRIIGALLEIPREKFVPPAQRALAYLDAEVPVAGKRALLKPLVFGKLLQAAGITERDRVLDVGCATGYSSAVLGKLAGNVVALEEDPALARTASETLGALGCANVSVATGPLTAGAAQGAPYDAILLEGAADVVPDALTAQLKEGGRLLAVIGRVPMGKATLFRKVAGHVTAVALFDAGAPLLPGFAKPAAFVF